MPYTMRKNELIYNNIKTQILYKIEYNVKNQIFRVITTGKKI